MTDKRIKSYLEDRLKRLESIRNKRGWTTAKLGDMVCCKQTLEFIDSLQEEPVSEDTMTIRKEWFEHCKESWYNEGYIDGKYNRDRQFKEPVSEELEEAVDEYAPDFSNSIASKAAVDAVRDAFKAGAKWQKEQMIAKAIDGIARPDDNEIWCNLSTFNFKDGDKCKVILIKEN